MTRREQWHHVLEAEFKCWSDKSTEQLLSELRDERVYQLTFDSKEYNVEVHLLENTDQYLHVSVSVDDGTLPASLSPLNKSFIRKKQSNPRG